MDFTQSIQAPPVPEPAAAGLVGAAFAVMLMARRHRAG